MKAVTTSSDQITDIVRFSGLVYSLSERSRGQNTTYECDGKDPVRSGCFLGVETIAYSESEDKKSGDTKGKHIGCQNWAPIFLHSMCIWFGRLRGSV